MAVIAVLGGAIAAVGTIGSDAWWPVALGDHIRSTGGVAEGVPFATAPTRLWVNTTVAGQILMSWIGAAGSPGVLAAQCFSVILMLALLSWDARRRSGPLPGMAGVALALMAVGAAPALFIARVQLLSLVPFALLLAVLRREHEKPSARIWFAPLLLALWGNLHGAVLVGVAVCGCYLIFSRLRVEPIRATAVGLACIVSTCANPGLARAPKYYLDVFGGEATADSAGMWGRPDMANSFDLAMVVCILGLLLLAARGRPPLWEWATITGLTVGTFTAARNGVWLLAFLVGLAMTSATSSPQPRVKADRAQRLPRGARLGSAEARIDQPRGSIAGMAASVGVAALVAAGVLLARSPSLAIGDRDVANAVTATAGRVVLAPEPLSEQLAAAGATVWVSNPLDAFDGVDQRAYLAFLRGDGQAAARAFSAGQAVVSYLGSTDVALYRDYGFQKTLRVGSLIVLTR